MLDLLKRLLAFIILLFPYSRRVFGPPVKYNEMIYKLKGYIPHPYRDYWVPSTWDMSEPTYNVDECQIH